MRERNDVIIMIIFVASFMSGMRQMTGPSIDQFSVQTQSEPQLATVVRHGHDACRAVSDDTLRRGAERQRSSPSASRDRSGLAEALSAINTALARAVAGPTRVESDRERHRPSAGHESTATERDRQRPSAGHESTTSTEERSRPSAGHERTESD